MAHSHTTRPFQHKKRGRVNLPRLWVVSQFDFLVSGQSAQAWDNRGMKKSDKKLPQDPNKLAFEVVRLSTEEPTAERSPISEYLASIGRKGGLRGGVARAQKLSPKRRSSIAAKAANARWKKKS
jgi:hypothetical protein